VRGLALGGSPRYRATRKGGAPTEVELIERASGTSAVLTRARARQALECAALAAVYFGAAKFGLKLSVAHGVITPVWPPAGIAIAALLLRGPQLWPGIAVGALLSNATSGVSIAVACAIAAGNTAETLVGWYLLRLARFQRALQRSRDVVTFTLLAGFAATAVAATNGVTTLRLAGSPAAAHYGSAWSLWWLGDAMGVLLVAPVLLVWAGDHRRMPRRERLLEALGLGAVLAAAGAVVFLAGLWRYPYPIFPLLVLATMRFHQRGAATGSFIVAATAVAGAISGQTPLGDSPTTAVQIVQGVIAFTAVSLLALGATLGERDAASRQLRYAATSLAEAQQLAHVGSWEWHVPTNRITWSDELYRIYGVEPHSELSYESFLEHVHPEDRDVTRSVVERALEERAPFELTHRIVRDDGTVRWVVGRGRAVVDDTGRLVRMAGTAQDVTEQRATEVLRQSILATVSHELRTPLTAILGFSLTLRDRGAEIDDGTKQQLTEEVVLQSRRLERLLTDLLDVDRLRHGLVRAVRQPTDVGLLVARVVAATGHPVTVATDSVIADVDAAKVERIVENLIANAIKHTEPGTQIAVGLTTDGDDLLFHVDDCGDGIPDADKEEIFELFVRRGAERAPGTGVGLALVAQFVRLHDGTVWVEDRDGGGASFRVRLPGCVVG
jgi:PAS domain S-box-containing protein